MRLRLTKLLLSACTCMIFSCSKNGSDSPAAAPAPANLLAPTNNSACVSGVADDQNRFSVALTWSAALNTDKYTVVIKNLLTGKSFSTPVTTNSANILLEGNQPYGWYVLSASTQSAKTAQSAIWKFFLTGKASNSYSPFPAVADFPESGSVISSSGLSTISIGFRWSGSDIDNDIAGYSFYLDDNDGSTLISSGLTDSSSTQSLPSYKTYYWKVVTTDNAGNESTSPVFEVIVN